MNAKQVLNQLTEALNKLHEISMERYLSVEPYEGGFIPNTDIEYNVIINLYEGDKVVDSIMASVYDDEISGDKDDYIRNIAKDHFANITDDIRVSWF